MLTPHNASSRSRTAVTGGRVRARDWHRKSHPTVSVRQAWSLPCPSARDCHGGRTLATAGDMHMSTITVKDGTTIYYKDWGKGPVVTLSHGWPLNADMWDGQMLFLAQHGFRVVAHDRRGHGRSSQAWSGNDMDGYADDLAAVIEALDLDGHHDGRPLDWRRRSRALHRTVRHEACGQRRSSSPRCRRSC